MKRYDHSLGFRRLLMTHGPHLQAMQDDMDALYLRTNPRIVIPKAWSDSASESLLDFTKRVGNVTPMPYHARYLGMDLASGDDTTVVVTQGSPVQALRREDLERMVKVMGEASIKGDWVGISYTPGQGFTPHRVNPRTGRKVLQLPRKSRV